MIINLQLTASFVLVSSFWCCPKALFQTVHRYTAPSVFLCGTMVRTLLLGSSLLAPMIIVDSSSWLWPSLYHFICGGGDPPKLEQVRFKGFPKIRIYESTNLQIYESIFFGFFCCKISGLVFDITFNSYRCWRIYSWRGWLQEDSETNTLGVESLASASLLDHAVEVAIVPVVGGVDDLEIVLASAGISVNSETNKMILSWWSADRVTDGKMFPMSLIGVWPESLVLVSSQSILVRTICINGNVL